jgi:uncharacterized protein (DUF1697 family)
MPVYISMLRGLNVAGHNLLKMAELRELFEKLGFKQCQTYIQSGNVIFKAGRSSTAGLSRKIEAKIAERFGFQPSVITRTAEEMAGVIERNPFVKMKGIDVTKLHVTFLSAEPSGEGLKALEPLAIPPDAFRSSGCAIYLYCPNGYGVTKLGNNMLERRLKVTATTRNWNTVNKLHEMAMQCGSDG